jgi:hypothetical protein
MENLTKMKVVRYFENMSVGYLYYIIPETMVDDFNKTVEALQDNAEWAQSYFYENFNDYSVSASYKFDLYTS